MNKVTAEQAKKAIKLIKDLCESVSDADCLEDQCPLTEWCWIWREELPCEWEVE